MVDSGIKKRRYKNAPGISVECKSGRFLAFYDHRTDIVAHGDNEVEAKRNLKTMYKEVMKFEKEEEEKKEEPALPADLKIKRFVERVPIK